MDEPGIDEELRSASHEPLLPVEKRLIAWNFGLGVALIRLLVRVSDTFFEG
jgi:hypothetical protein